MKVITREELKDMLAKYGHHCWVRVPIADRHGDTELRTVLNNGMVYNPFVKCQLGMSSNEENAETALHFITTKVMIYSGVFEHVSDVYEIQN